MSFIYSNHSPASFVPPVASFGHKILGTMGRLLFSCSDDLLSFVEQFTIFWCFAFAAFLPPPWMTISFIHQDGMEDDVCYPTGDMSVSTELGGGSWAEAAAAEDEGRHLREFMERKRPPPSPRVRFSFNLIQEQKQQQLHICHSGFVSFANTIRIYNNLGCQDFYFLTLKNRPKGLFLTFNGALFRQRDAEEVEEEEMRTMPFNFFFSALRSELLRGHFNLSA